MFNYMRRTGLNDGNSGFFAILSSFISEELSSSSLYYHLSYWRDQHPS